MAVLFTAEHQGPFRTLLNLREGALEARWVLGNAAAAIAAAEGVEFERQPSSLDGIDAVIRGTSETPGESNVEDTVSRAAAAKNIPVFAVEDYPLNYRPVDGAPLAGLFVELDTVRSRHAARGIPAERIHVSGNPRYARSVAAFPRWTSDDAAPLVLWAGQPDGELSFGTLKALLPSLEAYNARLAVRAHPRDAFYLEGHYDALLEASPIQCFDVTALSNLDSLYNEVNLVATQYSTLALEAQCRGIPALFVLLPGLGEASIRRFKGHDWLPWPEIGAAMAVRRREDIHPAVKSGIYDTIRRNSVLQKFAELTTFNCAAPKRIWTTIRQQLTRSAGSR